MSWFTNLARIAPAIGLPGVAYWIAGSRFGDKDGAVDLDEFAGGVNTVMEMPGVRHAIKGTQFLYNEFASQPASTLLGVQGQLATGQFSFSDPIGEIRDAYTRAEDISPGEQLMANQTIMNPALSLLNRDVDPRLAVENPELIREQGGLASAAFNIGSGGTDLLANFVGDPTVVVGKTLKVTRLALAINPLTDASQIGKRVESGQMSKFLAWTEGKTAEQISKHTVMKASPEGPRMAWLLAQADDMEQKQQIIRIALGDQSLLDELGQKRLDLRSAIQHMGAEEIPMLRLALDTDPIRDIGAALKHFDDADALARAEQELGSLNTQFSDLDRLLSVEREMTRQTPAATIGINNWRADLRIKQQNYQRNIYHTPLRAFFSLSDKLPIGYIDLNRSTSQGVEEMSRFLYRLPELDDVTRQKYVDRYSKASTHADRFKTVLDAENAAVGVIAARHGVSVDAVGEIMRQARGRRSEAIRRVVERRYTAATVGDQGTTKYADLFDSDGVATSLPLTVEQLANTVPMVDIVQLNKLVKRNQGALRTMANKTELAEYVADRFNYLWKASVLFRLGYPIRVVADEELRVMAYLSSIGNLSELGPGLRHMVLNNKDRLKEVMQGRAAKARGVEPQKGVRRRIGQEEFAYRGIQFEGAVGGETGDIWSQLISSDEALFRSTLMESADQKLSQMRQYAANWTVIPGNSASWGMSWERSVNQQLRKNPIVQRMLEGMEDEDIVRWLWGAGSDHRRAVPWWGDDPDDWVGRIRSMVDQYIPQPLRGVAQERNLRLQDWDELMGTQAVRPNVHGAEIDLNLGQGLLMETVDDIINKGYRFLASLPTDVLVRQPFFNTLYRNRLRELVDNFAAQRELTELTAEQQITFQRMSREWALREMRGTLYDLSTKSSAASALRFMAPFMFAWQEALTRWWALGKKNPAVFGRAAQAIRAPYNVFNVVDSDGQSVKEWKGFGSERHYIQLALPEKYLRALGVNTEEARIPLASFDLLTYGEGPFDLPWGPLTQIPANEFLLRNPEWEEVLRPILPFGPQEKSWMNAVAPSIKRAWAAFDEDGSEYTATSMRFYQWMASQHSSGKRKEPPTWDEANKMAKHFLGAKFLAGAVLPFPPNIQVPGQFYVDEVNRLMSEDPRTAHERFLELHGEDFEIFLARRTKNITGIPSTIEAVKKSRKWAPLIEENPELGFAIVGNVAGDFSMASYRWQTRQGHRERVSPEQAIELAEAQKGWRLYVKGMALIEAERVDRGLPNLRVKDAADLREAKNAIITSLMRQNTAWRKDYNERDFDKTLRTVEAFSKIAPVVVKADPGRTDMKTMLLYLQGRQYFVEELRRRDAAGGSADITAKSNQDLAQLWDTVTARLREMDLHFDDIFSRHLENDNLRPMIGVGDGR